MNKQFVVIAYDIPDDRRRTKLHKKLRSYGTPVQYSVFECIVDDRTLQKLRAVLQRIIDPAEDLLRLYFLCQICQGRVEAFNGEVTHEVQTLTV